MTVVQLYISEILKPKNGSRILWSKSLFSCIFLDFGGVECVDDCAFVYLRNTQMKDRVSHLVIQLFGSLYISRFWRVCDLTTVHLYV